MIEVTFPIACGLMGMLCGMLMMKWKCMREFDSWIMENHND